MIRIYTFKEYLNEENRRIIFPLLLDLCYIHNRSLLEYYEVVPEMNEAEIVIIPLDIGYFYRNKRQAALFEMIAQAKKEKKTVWAYSRGDIGKTLNADVFTFRFGGFDSKLDSKTFILPAFFQDPYLSLVKEDFHSLKKEKRPRVGFVGHAHNSRILLLREYLVYLAVRLINRKNKVLDHQSFFPTAFVRKKYLRKLEENPLINTSFIYRRRYRAGAKTEEKRVETALQFFENIKNSPYTFCIRGSGNFSVRFYETLAMGRIPVLILTDNRLPLSWIEWEKHIIHTSYDKLEESIINFHNTITPVEFEEMQRRNRELWLTRLTREGYFVEIHNHFQNHLI